MAKENDGQITLTKEELELMLADAARRGAEDAQGAASKMVDCDEDDAKALAFIKTFGPDDWSLWVSFRSAAYRAG